MIFFQKPVRTMILRSKSCKIKRERKMLTVFILEYKEVKKNRQSNVFV